MTQHRLPTIILRAALCACAFIAAGSPRAAAQKAYVATNFLDWASLVTLNAEGGVAVGRHVTLAADIRYNPFEFKAGEDRHPLRYRQFSLGMGARWWPWHILSGWWIGGKGRYQVYNTTGIYKDPAREGQRYGAELSGGYTYLVAPRFNLEFGAGVWAGRDHYTVYDCPTCGLTLDKGQKTFILPSHLLLGISYVF